MLSNGYASFLFPSCWSGMKLISRSLSSLTGRSRAPTFRQPGTTRSRRKHEAPGGSNRCLGGLEGSSTADVAGGDKVREIQPWDREARDATPSISDEVNAEPSKRRPITRSQPRPQGWRPTLVGRDGRRRKPAATETPSSSIHTPHHPPTIADVRRVQSHHVEPARHSPIRVPRSVALLADYCLTSSIETTPRHPVRGPEVTTICRENQAPPGTTATEVPESTVQDT